RTDQYFPILIYTFQFAPFVCGFNLDTENPRIFPSPQDGSAFGHRVCPFGSKPGDSVLVTDPLYGNGTGGVFRCFYGDGRCEAVHVDGSAFGLSLSCSDQRAVVCGPHLVQKCEGFNYLNGICAEFNPDISLSQTVRPSFQECHVILPMDAVILFDDSLSITNEDFKRMIQFIKDIIKAFIEDDRAQVGVAKFSTHVSAVFNFENYALKRNVDELMKDVSHSKGQTYTTSAIRYVLNSMFQESVGMRNKSQKLLVVITDGKSNDKDPLDTVISQAKKRGITRFAIGVGHQYSRDELEEIASSNDFVFTTASFSALANILKELTQKIFAIEGADVGKSFQLELSQGGFSVALSGEVSVFGAVGAFSWSGGLEKRLHLNASFINASKLQEDMTNSYLGYSVTVATVEGSVVYFAGAPRHKHIGMVLGFSRNQDNDTWMVTHRADGSQLGSYFGAELCVLDGLLAVGAPLFYAAGVGGEVTIYSLSTAALNRSGVLRGAPGGSFGRFGSALAALQDLNGDGLWELGVGAPHEEGGKGAVYIFLSQPGGIRTKHSQRVRGAAVGAGLKYFGVSLHSAVDLSSDGLPDIVVGSKGAASVVRTQPVICANVSITLDPPIISQNYFHCSAPHGLNTPIANAVVCVNITKVSVGTIRAPLSANVSINLELDPGPWPRLLLSPKSSTSIWSSRVSSVCSTHSITIPRCISDYREVPLSIKLTVVGDAVEGTAGLKPVQHPDCTHTFKPMVSVLLEKVCGEDHVCRSDLNVSLGFSRNMVVNIQDFPMNLSVVVINNGEDATDTELLFHHPSIFSFTRVTVLESSGHAWCVSNETGLMNVTQTTCKLGVAVFRQKAKAVLNLTFRVSDPSALGDQLTVNASVMSKNENNGSLHDNAATVSVPVKQLVNFQLENDGSTQYIRYDQSSLINHTFKLVNLGELSIPVSVQFVLPLEMSSGFLWDVSPPAFNGSGVKCNIPDTPRNNRSLHTQYCNGSSCRLFNCSVQLLSSNQPISFQFRGHIKSQTKVKSPDFTVSVVSWGFVSFDEHRYTQFLNEEALQHSIVTEVESPSQAQTVLIACLSIFFGLLVMAVIFYLLYRVSLRVSEILQELPAGQPWSYEANSDKTVNRNSDRGVHMDVFYSSLASSWIIKGLSVLID
uniref:VWFA domain-containing protein n=1 Tax=Pygocentrus nattereri TaxID=42514 RepID=A0AAR2J600_PYGNA